MLRTGDGGQEEHDTVSSQRGTSASAALLTALWDGRRGSLWSLSLEIQVVCRVNQPAITCKHDKAEAYAHTALQGKTLIQLTEDQGHSQLTQGQLSIMAAPGLV